MDSGAGKGAQMTEEREALSSVNDKDRRRQIASGEVRLGLELGCVSHMWGGFARVPGRMATRTPRHQVLFDGQWERVEPVLPSDKGRKGHPFQDNRKIVEGTSTGPAPGSGSAICPVATSAPGRRYESATTSTLGPESGTESMPQ